MFFINFDLVINRCQSKYTNLSIFYASKPIRYNIQVTATDGDKDRPQNIVYFLTGQGIDPDNPANSKFDINRTTGEIFVLKVSAIWFINRNKQIKSNTLEIGREFFTEKRRILPVGKKWEMENRKPVYVM